ncbi:MAG: nucleotidyltransferase domain-containing protein [Chloroflexi bacterium]|nr:nucleotidyltransferase domain-containing protein [Chloroflexota bacterium]
MNDKPEELQQILKDLRKALEDIYGADLNDLILFGSEARGTASENSDIDIALILRHPVQPGQEIARLGALLAELNLKYQRLISIIPASVENYRHSPDPLWQNIRREGIRV